MEEPKDRCYFYPTPADLNAFVMWHIINTRQGKQAGVRHQVSAMF